MKIIIKNNGLNNWLYIQWQGMVQGEIFMDKEEKQEKNLQKSIKIDEKLVFEALITYFQQSNYLTESEGALLRHIIHEDYPQVSA